MKKGQAVCVKEPIVKMPEKHLISPPQSGKDRWDQDIDEA
jgi:hypothetical protein